MKYARTYPEPLPKNVTKSHYHYVFDRSTNRHPGCDFLHSSPTTQAQRPPLDQTLLQENIQLLAKEARQKGIARRGALLFHSPGLGCWKCHAADSEANLIGPVLSEWTNPPSDVHLVESILDPSKVIADSYRAKQWLTVDGENIVGIPIEVGENEVIVRTGPGTWM